jgi:hypothetical protein
MSLCSYLKKDVVNQCICLEMKMTTGLRYSYIANLKAKIITLCFIHMHCISSAYKYVYTYSSLLSKFNLLYAKHIVKRLQNIFILCPSNNIPLWACDIKSSCKVCFSFNSLSLCAITFWQRPEYIRFSFIYAASFFLEPFRLCLTLSLYFHHRPIICVRFLYRDCHDYKLTIRVIRLINRTDLICRVNCLPKRIKFEKRGVFLSSKGQLV